jgi:hypothetical protein
LPPQMPAPDPFATAPFNTVSIGTYGGYMDSFSPNALITDENNLAYGFLHDLSDCGPYLNWSGMSSISITSMPNPDDISTWTWMAKYAASGENLEAPEPNTISIAGLAAVFGITRLFCKFPKPRRRTSPKKTVRSTFRLTSPLKRVFFLQNAGLKMVFCDGRPIPWLNNQRSPQTIIWRASAPFASLPPVCQSEITACANAQTAKGHQPKTGRPMACRWLMIQFQRQPGCRSANKK